MFTVMNIGQCIRWAAEPIICTLHFAEYIEIVITQIVTHRYYIDQGYMYESNLMVAWLMPQLHDYMTIKGCVRQATQPIMCT